MQGVLVVRYDVMVIRTPFHPAILAFFLVCSCSGSRNSGDEGPVDKDKERLIDALTMFVESVQGERYDMAMGFLTIEEKSKLTDPSGQVPASVQKQLKALRLSTLANKSGVRLQKGKLEGIQPWLPNIAPSAPTSGGADSLPPLIQ